MRNLKISYTCFPSGAVRPYTNGMPQGKLRAINEIGYNMWCQYIHSFTKPENTIKEGGVCYIDNQEAVLNEAKNLINK